MENEKIQKSSNGIIVFLLVIIILLVGYIIFRQVTIYNNQNSNNEQSNEVDNDDNKTNDEVVLKHDDETLSKILVNFIYANESKFLNGSSVSESTISSLSDSEKMYSTIYSLYGVTSVGSSLCSDSISEEEISVSELPVYFDNQDFLSNYKENKYLKYDKNYSGSDKYQDAGVYAVRYQDDKLYVVNRDCGSILSNYSKIYLKDYNRNNNEFTINFNYVYYDLNSCTLSELEQPCFGTFNTYKGSDNKKVENIGYDKEVTDFSKYDLYQAKFTVSNDSYKLKSIEKVK